MHAMASARRLGGGSDTSTNVCGSRVSVVRRDEVQADAFAPGEWGLLFPGPQRLMAEPRFVASGHGTELDPVEPSSRRLKRTKFCPVADGCCGRGSLSVVAGGRAPVAMVSWKQWEGVPTRWR